MGVEFSRVALAIIVMAMPIAADAATGVGDPIYGATFQRGTTEFEARYGRLTSGVDDGEDGLVFEAEHAFSDKFVAALLVETERGPGGKRFVDAAALEAIHTVGRIDALALDIAAYGEYKFGFRGANDALEVKLLLEHKRGPFDARLNLIAERDWQIGAPIELGYAASVDWAVAGDELRLGLAGFGDLGSTQSFGGRQEHFVGPEAKFEIEKIAGGEIEIEAGWLKAFGSARDRTNGQARLLVGYELHF